jgi:hypothetical protein
MKFVTGCCSFVRQGSDQYVMFRAHHNPGEREGWSLFEYLGRSSQRSSGAMHAATPIYGQGSGVIEQRPEADSNFKNV